MKYQIGMPCMLRITERASYHPNWLKYVWHSGILVDVDYVAGTATIKGPKCGHSTGSLENLKVTAARKLP